MYNRFLTGFAIAGFSYLLMTIVYPLIYPISNFDVSIQAAPLLMTGVIGGIIQLVVPMEKK